MTNRPLLWSEMLRTLYRFICLTQFQILQIINITRHIKHLVPNLLDLIIRPIIVIYTHKKMCCHTWNTKLCLLKTCTEVNPRSR